MILLSHAWAGFTAIVAFRPRFFPPHRRIAERAASTIRDHAEFWASKRCGAGQAEAYVCPPPLARQCIFLNRRNRVFKSYVLGPLGWTGEPDRYPPGTLLAFLGVRLDLLDRGGVELQGAMAHEMAHERQCFCARRYPARKEPSLWHKEAEAELEECAYHRGDGRHRRAAMIALAAKLRAPIAALLDALRNPRLSLLGPVIAVAMAFVALIITPLPNWVDRVLRGAAVPVALCFATLLLMIVLYKFVSGVWLSIDYRRQIMRLAKDDRTKSSGA